MRFRTLGFAGYLLSAFIVLLITIFPQVVLFFIFLLPPYFVSIILRFLAWYGIGKNIGGGLFKVIALTVLTFSILYLALLLLLLGNMESLIFIIPWAIYSVVEAIGYANLGRRGSKLAYVGLINIPAVLGLTAMILTATILEDFTGFPLVRGLLGLLVVSSTAMALSFKRLSPVATPRAVIRSATVTGDSVFSDTTENIWEKTTIIEEQRIEAKHGRTLRIEVITKSEDMVCRECGYLNPVDARVCAACGKRPYLDGPGAKCPICKAPLVYATSLDKDRVLCGVCFSELQIIRYL